MNGKIEQAFKGKTVVCLDTAPIIYFIEENSAYLETLQHIFLRIDEGNLSAFSSYITLMEVLVKPIETQALDLARQYRDLLIGSPGFDLYPLERTVAEKAANLRSKYKLKSPDAIQIATAILFGAQIFLTNDSGFKKVTEIEVLTLDELLS